MSILHSKLCGNGANSMNKFICLFSGRRRVEAKSYSFYEAALRTLITYAKGQVLKKPLSSIIYYYDFNYSRKGVSSIMTTLVTFEHILFCFHIGSFYCCVNPWSHCGLADLVE